nr:signal recognition particle subunit srp72 [Quercus suber]
MSSTIPSITTLLKQSNIDDHEEVLRAANSTLKQLKNDSEAQNVKIIALLKLERYDDAIHTFDTAGDRLKEDARLEYAYALYRSGRPEQAIEVAKHGNGRGFQHVEAQARYREEDFKRAAELYEQLASHLGDDAEADLRINTGAVDAQLEWSGQGAMVRKKKPSREDLEAFETAYNAACGSIARGELGQGEVLLRRSKDLCNALEDMSDEEKQAELLPITVQQIYVLSRQGRSEEAEELARTVSAKSIPDASTRLIAEVNSVATSTTASNPYLAHRLVSQDISSLRPDHPFRYQSDALERSRRAADLHILKFAGSADSTAATIAKQTAPNLDAFTNSLSVINAAAHAKNETGKQALKHILPVLEKRPADIGLVLTIVQLYMLTGNSASAISLLESFLARLEQSGSTAELDVRFAPGLVGAMVGLYHNAGRKSNMHNEYYKAASHWRRKSSDRQPGVLHLLKAAASALLESQETEHQNLVKEIFTELYQLDNSDRFAAAGLLAASPESASSPQIQSLTSVGRLIMGIDVDALESAGVAVAPTATAVVSRKRPAEDSKPKKAKKVRKSRLPKDYDPSKKPDPERWLPLRDRSTYRPKGKKGKARQALLSQGSAAPAGDNEGSRPATPGGEVVKGKQAGSGANAKKNKKKSGKR